MTIDKRKPMIERCSSHGVLWPDVEALDFQCDLYTGHDSRHRDDSMGISWDSDSEFLEYCDYETIEWE